MISGTLLSWGNSLVQHHRFRHSVQGVCSRLSLCSEIASCYQTDVEVILRKIGNDVELSCIILDRIQPSLEKLLHKKTCYSGIKNIFLDEQQTEDVHIQFSSNICLQEKLTFYSTKNKRIHIDIPTLLISTN